MKSAGVGSGGGEVGGFSHSIFLKCSDTLHLQLSPPPPVSSEPKQGSALFKNPAERRSVTKSEEVGAFILNLSP